MDTTRRILSLDAVLKLGQRLRRWPSIEPTLVESTMFEKKSSCQYKRGVNPFGDHRSNTISLISNPTPSKGFGGVINS